MSGVNRRAARKRRHLKVRKRIFGTTERPRLCVFRSLNHIYAQVIDDVNGKTIISASSLDPEVKSKHGKTGNAEAAKTVGLLLADRAKGAGIQTVHFDRGGNLYHGRVAALADGAREGGLEF